MYYKFKLVTCPLGLYINPLQSPTSLQRGCFYIIDKVLCLKNILKDTNDNYLLQTLLSVVLAVTTTVWQYW